MTNRAELWLCLSLVIVSCTGPSVVVGPGDPAKLMGGSASVSAVFGAQETNELHRRVTSGPFRGRLRRYTCGDALPRFEVTVAFWPERAGIPLLSAPNERVVFIYTDPELGARHFDQCLMVGFSYEVDRVLLELDQGPLIDYKIKHPLTGQVLPPRPYGQTLLRPLCDCSKRATDKLWVDVVEEAHPTGRVKSVERPPPNSRVQRTWPAAFICFKCGSISRRGPRR